MNTRLVLIRHGNTFDKGDEVLRCGCRTDLPLSSSGRMQASKLGDYLKSSGFKPDYIYVSPLRRTQETAQIASSAFETAAIPSAIHPALNELDYGPDEGKPETDVIARLGQETLTNWDQNDVMPAEWSPKPANILSNTRAFLDHIRDAHAGQTVWAVTSNRIARFFTQHAVWASQRPDHLKLSTAAYACFEFDGEKWTIQAWNSRAE